MSTARQRTLTKQEKDDTDMGANFSRLPPMPEASSFKDKKDHAFSSGTLIKVGVSVLCGTIFGIAIEKSRVFDPAVVTSQMLMQKFIMMKMFLTSLTVGMFSLGVLAILPVTRNSYLMARAAFLGGVHNKGYFGVCLGAAILGSGMSVVGTCPGILSVQMGAGIQNAVYAVGGAVMGTVVYSVLEPYITSLVKPSTPVKYHFLYQLFGAPPFIVSFPLFSMLGILVFSLEMAFPWQHEVVIKASDFVGKAAMANPFWHPYLCGSLVGALQIPLVIFLGDTLGGTQCYCTVMSQGLVTSSSRKMVPYLTKFQRGMGNWWQVFFMVGSAMGAYLSATSSGQYGVAVGPSPGLSVTGGLMVIFGARLAGGCTSGHGLSGVGLLNMMSMAAVASMFSGGIVTAHLLRFMS